MVKKPILSDEVTLEEGIQLRGSEMTAEEKLIRVLLAGSPAAATRLAEAWSENEDPRISAR